MADVNFNRVEFYQNNEDRINVAKRKYKIIMSKCGANTAFQLSHFDLLMRGYDLMDFANEEYWSEITLKKIEEYIDDVSDILNSSEFKSIQETLKICSKVMSSQIQNKK